MEILKKIREELCKKEEKEKKNNGRRKEKVKVKFRKGKAVITDKGTYTISKFANFIPQVENGAEYEIETCNRNFIYSMKKVGKGENKIKGLLIIDFETSGDDICEHYPLSIGLIKTDLSLNIEDIYYSKIFAPPHNAKEEAMKINKLQFEDGKFAETIVFELNHIVGNWREYRITGWNVGFDFNFLKKLFKMANKEFNGNYNLLDIQSIYVLWQYKKFGTMEIKGMRQVYEELFGSELTESHNAIEDCLAELFILRKLIKEI